jgi:hypothetical protein
MIYPKKPVRQSQLITPWGVGAIVPFPGDESLMIAGLDRWEFGENKNDFVIKDIRLEKRLGTDELRCPPDFHDPSSGKSNAYIKIPAVRFPCWHYCPNCGSMSKAGYFSQQERCDQYKWSHGRDCSKSKYPRKMIPERFIVICPEGHVDDFPIIEWVHSDKKHSYNPKTCRIRRSTGGKSAALTGVFYECTCGAKRSLQGATTEGALAKIGYRCKGAKPWLGIEEDQNDPCGRTDVKVIQRGGTNVWFADVKSSIYIPIEADETAKKVQNIAERLYPIIKNQRTNGTFNEDVIKAFAEDKGVDSVALSKAIMAIHDNIQPYNEITEDISEEEFRIAEFQVLNKSSGSDEDDFHSVYYDISNFNQNISEYFSNISLVPKLRETRALVGFSRLIPDDRQPISEKKKKLRLDKDDKEKWLPAIQVFGEGIFINFDATFLENWSMRSGIQDRMKNMNKSFNKMKNAVNISLNAKYVLIHTFAHLLINQLSYNCGYGSSSIRERIFCGKTDDSYNMHGVLLYTASGDSEGSMGGLVRQGRPGIIEPIIQMAIENAFWCSGDPVCIQSSGQGPDNCNLAACHNCALLPETCCENGNRLLDRALLIGTINEREIGYFSELIKH